MFTSPYRVAPGTCRAGNHEIFPRGTAAFTIVGTGVMGARLILEMGDFMRPFAAVVAGADGVIQSWNAEAEALFGYPAGKAVGQTLDLLVPEAYRDRHWAAFHALMAHVEDGIDRGAVRLPVLHSDGEARPCAVRLVALLDPWDRPVGAVAVFARDPDDGNAPPLPEL